MTISFEYHCNGRLPRPSSTRLSVFCCYILLNVLPSLTSPPRTFIAFQSSCWIFVTKYFDEIIEIACIQSFGCHPPPPLKVSLIGWNISFCSYDQFSYPPLPQESSYLISILHLILDHLHLSLFILFHLVMILSKHTTCDQVHLIFCQTF